MMNFAKRKWENYSKSEEKLLFWNDLPYLKIKTFNHLTSARFNIVIKSYVSLKVLRYKLHGAVRIDKIEDLKCI